MGGDINALTRTLVDSQFKPPEGTQPNSAEPRLYPSLSKANPAQRSPLNTDLPEVALPTNVITSGDKVSNNLNKVAVAYSIATDD